MSDGRETHERDTAQPGDTEENTKDSGSLA